jgi:spore coat protein CotF
VFYQSYNYYCNTKNTSLKEIIYNQYVIMHNHVMVMLKLIDPKTYGPITIQDVQQMNPVQIPCHSSEMRMSEKSLAYENRNTAKTMALDYFTSALRMKDPNVRNVHFQMALQQVALQESYSNFIKELGWDQAVDVTYEQQREVLERIKRLFNE